MLWFQISRFFDFEIKTENHSLALLNNKTISNLIHLSIVYLVCSEVENEIIVLERYLKAKINL